MSIDPREDDSAPHPGRTVASVLWRRLDVPGHDACRLEVTPEGWTVAGTALFRHGNLPAQLDYRVSCDSEWRTRRGRVRGLVGPLGIDITVVRSGDQGWMLDSKPVADLEGCTDLDLDFTPATNLLHLRRLAMAEQDRAELPVALLRLPEGALVRLDQRLQRTAPNAYWYEAPDVGYAGLLEVDAVGFVTHYPGLWEAESILVFPFDEP